MIKKRLIYSVSILILVATLFSCKKKDISANKKNNDMLILAYEELGRKHNEFLSKAFPEVKRRLTEAMSKTKSTSAVSPEMTYEVMLDVSTEYLLPVTDYHDTKEQVLTYLQQYMPQDLVFTEYTSAASYLQSHLPGIAMSPEFSQALSELDNLLDQCADYNETKTLVPLFDALRNKYISSLTIPAEQEAFTAATTVGKHSFIYWSEHEQEVLQLFDGGNTLKTMGLIGKQNAVKADAFGILRGAWKGAFGGFAWGGLWGSIALGLLNGAYEGCVASLGAGLINGLVFRK